MTHLDLSHLEPVTGHGVLLAALEAQLTCNACRALLHLTELEAEAQLEAEP